MLLRILARKMTSLMNEHVIIRQQPELPDPSPLAHSMTKLSLKEPAIVRAVHCGATKNPPSSM